MTTTSEGHYFSDMPYQKKPPQFDTPSDHQTIWRYMSIEKFMSMLYTQSLYFPNISSFSDKKEGTLSDKSKDEVYKTNLLDVDNTPIEQDDNFQKMKAYVEDNEQFHTDQETKEYWQNRLNSRHSFETLLQLFSNHLMFCNSWFLKPDESYVMWAGYGDNVNPTSVAIQTTIGAFIRSIESTSYQIHIGAIQYKDYDTKHIEGYEDFLSKNLNDHGEVLKLFYAPVLHKRNIYQEENEVRAIISFEDICTEYLDRIYTSEIPFYSDQLFRKQDDPFLHHYPDNIMKDIPKKGIHLENIDLQILLKKIVVSPNIEKYYYSPFRDIVDYYGIDPSIVSRSKI